MYLDFSEKFGADLCTTLPWIKTRDPAFTSHLTYFDSSTAGLSSPTKTVPDPCGLRTNLLLMGVSDDVQHVIVCVRCLFICMIYLDAIQEQTTNNRFLLCSLLMQTKIQLQTRALYIEMMSLDVRAPNRQYKVAIYGRSVLWSYFTYAQNRPWKSTSIEELEVIWTQALESLWKSCHWWRTLWMLGLACAIHGRFYWWLSLWVSSGCLGHQTLPPRKRNESCPRNLRSNHRQHASSRWCQC